MSRCRGGNSWLYMGTSGSPLQPPSFSISIQPPASSNRNTTEACLYIETVPWREQKNLPEELSPSKHLSGGVVQVRAVSTLGPTLTDLRSITARCLLLIYS